MDSAARRQKLLEVTGFELAASAVTICGKLTARCVFSSCGNSGSGILPGPQAVLVSIVIKDECLHALSQPDRNAGRNIGLFPPVVRRHRALLNTHQLHLQHADFSFG